MSILAPAIGPNHGSFDRNRREMLKLLDGLRHIERRIEAFSGGPA